MYKVVIFDLDDTLIAEEDFVRSGYNAVSIELSKRFQNFSKEYIFDKLLHLYLKDSKNVFNRFFEEEKKEYKNEDIVSLVNIYRTHKPDIDFFLDAKEIIQKLKEKNIKIGIITDGYLETQRNKLEKIGAYNIFDEIIITDELGKEYWKPSPKSFKMMKERFKVKYEEMIYVGDNPEKDFYISKIYPITCIRIIRKNGIYIDKEYKENIKPQYEISNLNYIVKIIDKDELNEKSIVCGNSS